MPHHLKNITFTIIVTLALLVPSGAGAAQVVKELAEGVFMVKVGDFLTPAWSSWGTTGC